MEKPFEKAFFISKIAEAGRECSRVYIGSEFCENLIPAFPIFKEWYAKVQSLRVSFTLVTPYVTDTGMDRLKPLLRFLNQQGCAEVVVNDWGVLTLLRDNYPQIEPVLGRLLTKQRRDPRMEQIIDGTQHPVTLPAPEGGTPTVLMPKRPPRTTAAHFRGSLINVPAFQKFLAGWGIRRVELDHLIWSMDVRLPPRLRASLYIPYAFMATTRMCGKISLSYAPCRKECKKYFLKLNEPHSPVPFYSIGNTIFYKQPAPDDRKLKELGIDRLVIQPRFPF